MMIHSQASKIYNAWCCKRHKTMPTASPKLDASSYSVIWLQAPKVMYGTSHEFFTVFKVIMMSQSFKSNIEGTMNSPGSKIVFRTLWFDNLSVYSFFSCEFCNVDEGLTVHLLRAWPDRGRGPWTWRYRRSKQSFSFVLYCYHDEPLF